MSTTETATEMFRCDVDGCEREFTTEPGLKRHKHEKHGAPRSPKTRTRPKAGTGKTLTPVKPKPTPTPHPTSLVSEVEAELAAMVAPLVARRTKLDDEIAKVSAQLAELRSARGLVEQTIRRVAPTQAIVKHRQKTGGNAARQEREDAERANVLRAYFATNPSALADGFTTNSLADHWRLSKLKPAMSQKTMIRAIEQLRDEGVLRADKVVQGGGMNYMIVSMNGGSHA